MWAFLNSTIELANAERYRCQRNFVDQAFKYDRLSFARLYTGVMQDLEDQINRTFSRLKYSFQFRNTFAFGEQEAEKALSTITSYLQLYMAKNITKHEMAKQLTSFDLQGRRIFIAVRLTLLPPKAEVR